MKTGKYAKDGRDAGGRCCTLQMQKSSAERKRCSIHGKGSGWFREKIRSASEIPEPEEIMDGYTLITMMRYIELTEEGE